MRRLAALLLGLLASCVLLGTTAPPALAHAALLSTTPGDAEILEQGPSEVTLQFSEPVTLGLGGVRVLDSDGSRVDRGELSRTDGGKKVHLGLSPALDAGTYVVVWRVVSLDAHPVSGAFTFVVRTPSVDPATLLGRGDLTSLAEGSAAPGRALGVTRFLGFSALVVLLGGALFGLLVSGSVTPRLRQLLGAAAAVELLASVGALLLEGPYVAGLPLSRAFDTDLVREVLDVQFGKATAARAVLALLALLLVRAHPALLAALGVGWAATWAAAGHAGTGEGQPWAFGFDLLHLVAVSAWVGGLVVIVLGLRGGWLPLDDLPRWSRVAGTSVVVLVLTGLWATFRQVGELGALFSTTYGRLVVTKSLLVGLMVLLAQIGRAFVRQHLTERTEEQVAGLRRGVVLEASLAAVVLAVTAWLVNSTPAKDAFAPPYLGRSTAGPLTVAVDIYPARKGLNGLHVYTVGAGGRTVDVAEVTGRVVRPGETLTLHLVHKSLGHYEDLDLLLPAKGSWTIELQVRVNDVDSYPTRQVFEVR